MEEKEHGNGELAQMVRDAISQAGSTDVLDVEEHFGFYTHNSRAFIFWDILMRNLRDTLPPDRFIIYKLKCSNTWESPLIYDVEKNELYTFINKYNFEANIQLQQNSPSRYIQNLLTLNPSIGSKGYGQQGFPFLGEGIGGRMEAIEYLRSSCSPKFAEIPWESVRYRLIVFKKESSRLTYLQAWLVDSYRISSEPENWMEETSPDISEIIERGKSNKDDKQLVVLKDEAFHKLKSHFTTELKDSDEKKNAQ